MDASRQIDRYEILEELGRGGMAVVYLARQRDLDRLVALKELSSFHRTDASWTSRFLRESRLAGSLAHANIVTVHDYIQVDGTPYIAMEYLRRGSLRPLMRSLELGQIAGVLADVLAGLEHAERRGIVHRDLKPENLLVTEEGRVKIADFGIAKATTDASFQTQTGVAVGTPGYMAPEQALAKNVGPWSDLYSVGCMAYEMCVRRLPFFEVEPMALMLRHISEPVVPAGQVNPELDPRLATWIDTLLVKNPSARPQSAVDAWETLEEILFDVLGTRWQRTAALPEAAATAATIAPQLTFTSALMDSSAFVDYEPAPRAAVLTRPPAGTPTPPLLPPPSDDMAIPDAIPGPYTPPPDGPVPASLIDAAAALAPPPADSDFVTFDPQPAPAQSAAAITPPPPTRTRVPATPSLPPERSRRAGRLAGVAFVAVAIVATAVVLSSGSKDTPATEQAAKAPVAKPQTVKAGALSLLVPGDWKPEGHAPAALQLDDAVSLRASDGGTVVAGLVPAKDVGATLLATDAPTEPETVHLGGLSAYRYDDVPLDAGTATVFAVPTGAGVATVACAGVEDCRGVAESIKVDGATVYPVGPSADYARTVERAVSDMRKATRSFSRPALAAKQARAAAGVSRRFDQIAGRLHPLTLSPADAGLNRRLAAAVAATAAAYDRLTAAARRNDRARYGRAATGVTKARRAVNTALGALAAAGYSDTGALGRARVPALKRPPTPKRTTPVSPRATPVTPRATPVPTIAPRNNTPVAPRPTAVAPKPTPIPPKPTPIPIEG